MQIRFYKKLRIVAYITKKIIFAAKMQRGFDLFLSCRICVPKIQV